MRRNGETRTGKLNFTRTLHLSDEEANRLPLSWLRDHVCLDTVKLRAEVDMSQLRLRNSEWKVKNVESKAHPFYVCSDDEPILKKPLCRYDNDIYWEIGYPPSGGGSKKVVFLSFSFTHLANGANYGTVSREQVPKVLARLNNELKKQGILGITIEEFQVCTAHGNLNLIAVKHPDAFLDILPHCHWSYMRRQWQHQEDGGGNTSNRSRGFSWYSKIDQLLGHENPDYRKMGHLLEMRLGGKRIIRIEAKANSAKQCRDKFGTDKFGKFMAKYNELPNDLYQIFEPLRRQLEQFDVVAREVKSEEPCHVKTEICKSIERWNRHDKALGLEVSAIETELQRNGLHGVKSLLSDCQVDKSNTRDFVRRLRRACIQDRTVRDPSTPVAISEMLECLQMLAIRKSVNLPEAQKEKKRKSVFLIDALNHRNSASCCGDGQSGFLTADADICELVDHGQRVAGEQLSCPLRWQLEDLEDSGRHQGARDRIYGSWDLYGPPEHSRPQFCFLARPVRRLTYEVKKRLRDTFCQLFTKSTREGLALPSVEDETILRRNFYWSPHDLFYMLLSGLPRPPDSIAANLIR